MEGDVREPKEEWLGLYCGALRGRAPVGMGKCKTGGLKRGEGRISVLPLYASLSALRGVATGADVVADESFASRGFPDVVAGDAYRSMLLSSDFDLSLLRSTAAAARPASLFAYSFIAPNF